MLTILDLVLPRLPLRFAVLNVNIANSKLNIPVLNSVLAIQHKVDRTYSQEARLADAWEGFPTSFDISRQNYRR